jgi:hypothetical protein
MRNNYKIKVSSNIHLLLAIICAISEFSKPSYNQQDVEGVRNLIMVGKKRTRVSNFVTFILLLPWDKVVEVYNKRCCSLELAGPECISPMHL